MLTAEQIFQFFEDRDFTLQFLCENGHTSVRAYNNRNAFIGVGKTSLDALNDLYKWYCARFVDFEDGSSKDTGK